MSSDFLYSCLMRSSWLFLGGWSLLLVAASFAAFHNDQMLARSKGASVRK